MDGYLAPLAEICDLAERHDAMVMVDDSHAVGFVGPRGRGTPELFDVVDRVDIVTGTLGKALGGASGGYVSGRREIVDLLRQRSRPYLFSNAVAPPIVAASMAVLDLLEANDDERERLTANTRSFRTRITDLGYTVLPGEHPIIPIMFGEASRAVEVSTRLLEQGVYAIAFSYPVVPMGEARIRTQMSAAHSEEELARAVAAFAALADGPRGGG
jgi:glycine C-acetyltransferase